VSEKQKIILKSFGSHIRNKRIGKNMTQVEVSSRMNRDQQSLQRVESGRVNPSLIYLLELAEALEIEISELVRFSAITE
jgi:transcriptional regulator with XRE-family HTH domain